MEKETHIANIIHWKNNNEMLTLYIDDKLIIHGDNSVSAIFKIYNLIESINWINQKKRWIKEIDLKINLYMCENETELHKQICDDKMDIKEDFNDIKDKLRLL